MNDSRRVGYEISKTSKLFRRAFEKNFLNNNMDKMTCTHGWAIHFFYDNRDNDIFQKDFERKFNIRRSTASNILKLMEENGLITRESVPNDARLKKIMLTPKALEINNQLAVQFDFLEDKIIRDISKEDLDKFFAVLDKINNNLERDEQKND